MIAKVEPAKRLARKAGTRASPGISGLALIEMIGIAASLLCGSAWVNREIGGPSLVAGLHEPAQDTPAGGAQASGVGATVH